MSYDPQTVDEILEGMLADWRNRRPGDDTSNDTEIFIRLATFAGGIWGLEHGLEYVEDQIFPDTADEANLVRHAAKYEITRKAAQAATDGDIRLTGVNGTIVAAGLVLAHEDGTTYTTTSGGTIASGNLEVTATCDQAGTVGNKGELVELTVQSPPAGVDAAALILSDFTDGTDQESVAALLERVLVRTRAGNAGGTASDYEQWALTVTGCAFAYALPLRRGAGTVDLAVFQADSDGNRIPASSTIRIAVKAYVETVRPVTADCLVPAVTPVDVDVDVEILLLDDGLEVADVEADVTAAIEAAIYAVDPGGTLYLAQLMRRIAAVEGVIDFTIVSPVVNTPSTVDPTVIQALRPGVITVT